MKTLLLAGGFGTRLSEETDIKPKPMVENRTVSMQDDLEAYVSQAKEKQLPWTVQ